MEENEIQIRIGSRVTVKANLQIPSDASSLVIFSHGSGSSRFSSRNRFVAERLNAMGIATLLTDLLTEEEDRVYANRFNIDLLTNRLVEVTRQVTHMPQLSALPVGYFGASTGAASALQAAATLSKLVSAVVSRGGRPDLAQSSLLEVKAPTLLIVGSLDTEVLMLNEQAYNMLFCEKQLEVIEGAAHLFEEPGKLEEVARLAGNWFSSHLHRQAEPHEIDR